MASAFLERDAHAGPIHEHEGCVEGGIGGNGLDIAGIWGWHLHVMGNHKTSGSDLRQQLLEVLGVSLLFGIDEQDVDRVGILCAV